MSLKCNEEEKSLSTETFAKVSLTNLRRQAVPDLASDLGINIFKKVRRLHADVIVDQNLIWESSELSSLRTGARTARGKVPSPSTMREKNDSAVWGCRSCSTRTSWMSHRPVAPSHLEASQAWAMIDVLWTVGAGRPPSWVQDKLANSTSSSCSKKHCIIAMRRI